MSRSAKERQDVLAKRKADTGCRGGATQGFGKDPPLGGRDHKGRESTGSGK